MDSPSLHKKNLYVVRENATFYPTASTIRAEVATMMRYCTERVQQNGERYALFLEGKFASAPRTPIRNFSYLQMRA